MKLLRPRNVFFLLAGFHIVRLLLAARLPLIPDEAYYWYWSLHPDASYMDHPPMIAYLIALSTALGGNTEFFVRLGGLVLTALVLCILYLTGRSLFPEKRETSWNVLLLFNVTILFSAVCLVNTPDTPLIFFWTIAVYCGSRIMKGGAASWWYAWGAALGLGLLSKYTMILIVPCTFAFLAASREDRRWLSRKEPYLALVLGFVLLAPVILWNWKHDWVSFAFQLHHGFSPVPQAAAPKLLSYFAGQAGFVTPLLFLAFVIASVTALRAVFRDGNRTHLYLLLLSWPVILFFAVSTIRGHIAEANWTTPAYIAGILLTQSAYEKYFEASAGHRRFYIAAVVLALSANILLHLHLVHPYLPVRPEKDITRRFHDWPGLGRMLETFIRENPDKNGYFLVSDTGTTVAEAVFYTGGKYTGVDLFRPERYLFLKDPEKLQGMDAIILTHQSPEFALNAFAPHFGSVEAVGRRPYMYRGKEIVRLSVNILLGKDYRGDFPEQRERRE
ncbi:MAG: 2 protein [Actinobacteria bacterium]|nr:2 protein [Actinomycetota bacterium]